MFPNPKEITPLKVVVIYVLALLLVSLHELDRIAGWIEEGGLPGVQAASVQKYVAWAKEVSVFIGAGEVVDQEKRWLTPLKTWPAMGEVLEPPATGWLRLGAEETVNNPERNDGPFDLSGLFASKPTLTDSVDQGPGLGEDKSISPTRIENGPDKPLQTRSAKIKPKTILIAGDSMILEGFGVALERALKKHKDLTVLRKGRYATGLTRPDYFDWPPYLQELLEAHQPDVLIISLGANDGQDIVDEDRKRHIVATKTWNELYQARVEAFLKASEEKGLLTFWVGLPIMGPGKYGERIANLNQLAEAACAKLTNCVYVNTWPDLADNQGNYTTFLTTAKGTHLRIRAKDNIHLTEAGGEIVTKNFLDKAKGYMELPPRIDKALAASSPKGEAVKPEGKPGPSPSTAQAADRISPAPAASPPMGHPSSQATPLETNGPPQAVSVTGSPPEAGVSPTKTAKPDVVKVSPTTQPAKAKTAKAKTVLKTKRAVKTKTPAKPKETSPAPQPSPTIAPAPPPQPAYNGL